MSKKESCLDFSLDLPHPHSHKKNMQPFVLTKPHDFRNIIIIQSECVSKIYF